MRSSKTEGRRSGVLAGKTRPPRNGADWREGPIFTVGHPTPTLEQFIALLNACGVERLVDIRTTPRSPPQPPIQRRRPVRTAASERDQLYGFARAGRTAAPPQGFAQRRLAQRRLSGYADYMQTADFVHVLEELMALSVRGVPVVEILSAASHRYHRLTPFAQVVDASITYPQQ